MSIFTYSVEMIWIFNVSKWDVRGPGLMGGIALWHTSGCQLLTNNITICQLKETSVKMSSFLCNPADKQSKHHANISLESRATETTDVSGAKIVSSRTFALTLYIMYLCKWFASRPVWTHSNFLTELRHFCFKKTFHQSHCRLKFTHSELVCVR